MLRLICPLAITQINDNQLFALSIALKKENPQLAACIENFLASLNLQAAGKVLSEKDQEYYHDLLCKHAKINQLKAPVKKPKTSYEVIENLLLMPNLPHALINILTYFLTKDDYQYTLNENDLHGFINALYNRNSSASDDIEKLFDFNLWPIIVEMKSAGFLTAERFHLLYAKFVELCQLSIEWKIKATYATENQACAAIIMYVLEQNNMLTLENFQAATAFQDNTSGRIFRDALRFLNQFEEFEKYFHDIVNAVSKNPYFATALEHIKNEEQLRELLTIAPIAGREIVDYANVRDYLLQFDSIDSKKFIKLIIDSPNNLGNIRYIIDMVNEEERNSHAFVVLLISMKTHQQTNALALINKALSALNPILEAHLYGKIRVTLKLLELFTSYLEDAEVLAKIIRHEKIDLQKEPDDLTLIHNNLMQKYSAWQAEIHQANEAKATRESAYKSTLFTQQITTKTEHREINDRRCIIS